MAGPRPEKVAVVEEVREHLGNSSAAILTEYRGLKVADLAVLRRQLRTAGAEYKIFKNTLVRRATTGTAQAALDPLLEGPTAIAFVRADVGAVAKVLREFSRAHPELIVKGGFLGTQLVDAQGASALADLPSREALLAQLAGAMAAPMRQFASLLQALPRGFAYALSALIEKRGGGDASAPAGVATAEPAVAEPAAATAEPAVAEPAAATAEPAVAEPAAATAEPGEAAEPSGTAEPGAVADADGTDTAEPAAAAETAAPAEGDNAEPAAAAETAAPAEGDNAEPAGD
ncbi:MAG: 50S ribosomal protein L10 [Acidimicrobiales bacterium]|jgi:large subunit ribosomal protein L10